MPGRHALIVATDTYGDAKLRRLRAPARDAAALADVLRDPEIGDFTVELADNQPESVLRRRIAAFFSDRARDDLLLLHFSCHGLKDDSGQLFFAAADTEVEQLDATAIPAEFVSRQMARSRSNSVLMLLDCCYSGAIARGLRFRAGDSVDVNDHLGGSGRAIITASNAMEYAFEGDELTGEGRPSVFTSAVVKALQTGEADRDQDHWISVRELYDYVCDAVREITPNQRPNMLSHLEGELFVARSRWLAPATLPRELLDALENPIPAVREGAVRALGALLGGRDRALAAAARARLEAVAAGDDSRSVSSAATAALATPAEPPAPARAAPPPPPPETPSPVSAAPRAETPAAAPAPARAAPAPHAATALDRTAVLLLVLLVAGALMAIGWFLPWIYDGPVPARAPDVEADDAIGFTVPLATGAVAVVLAGLALAGRGLRRPPPWFALALLAACTGGVLLAFRDATDGADHNAGMTLTALAAPVVLALAGHRTLAAGAAPPRPRVSPGDVVAAVGGVVVLFGTTRIDGVIGPLAAGPTAFAGALAIVALGLRAAPNLRGSRLLALVVAAGGPLALGAAGMAEMHGRPPIVAGAVLITVGGALALRARSGLALR